MAYSVYVKGRTLAKATCACLEQWLYLLLSLSSSVFCISSYHISSWLLNTARPLESHCANCIHPVCVCVCWSPTCVLLLFVVVCLCVGHAKRLVPYSFNPLSHFCILCFVSLFLKSPSIWFIICSLFLLSLLLLSLIFCYVVHFEPIIETLPVFSMPGNLTYHWPSFGQ